MKTRWIALAATWVAGCQGPLVGGHCAEGFAERAGECVRSEAPPSRGTGGGSGGVGGDDADGTGGAVVGPVTGSGGASSGGPGSGGASSGGPGGGGAGGTGADGGGGAGPDCAEQETACGATCVDLQTDATSCGACGLVCASGLCIDGHCEGEYAGHVVVAGFDETAMAAQAPVRILGNAVFAWPIDPVRVGVLRTSSAASGLPDALVAAADARGRSVMVETFTGAEALDARLVGGTLDVVVVGALAPDPQASDLLAHGLHDGVDALTGRGGIIAMLAGASDEPTSDAFLRATGWAASLDTRAAVTGNLSVVAFDDLLAAGVPTPFARPAKTVGVDFADFDGRTVVTDAAQCAVVLHAVIAPGTP